MKVAFLFESYGIKCESIGMNETDYQEIGMIPPQISSLSCCENNKHIKSFTIPTTIKSIQRYGFFDCGLLTSVTIPSSVTFIGESAFSLCKNLKQLRCEAQLTRLESYAFFANAFESFDIPTTVKEIGTYALGNCVELTKLVIPSSVTKIEEAAFQGSHEIKEFIIHPNIQMKVWPDCLFMLNTLTKIEFPTSITELADGAFDGCSSLQEIILPNVKRINNNVFKNCMKLEHINLPSTLTHIGSFAFENCFSLKELLLPNTVVSIGDQMLLECESLSKITLSSGLTSVDKLLFNKCSSLEQIWIGEQRISKYPFKVSYSIAKHLQQFTIQCDEIVLTKESLIELDYAEGSSFKIPNNVKELDDYLFRNETTLHSITIPSSVTSIGKDCFKNCKVEIINNSKVRIKK